MAKRALQIKHRAIVVGVNEYEDAQWRTLRFAEADAHDFARLLIEEGGWQHDDVQLFTKESTGHTIERDDIWNALFNAFRDPDLSSDSFLIFYFAGHGFLDLQQRAGYLAFYSTYEGHPSTGLPMSQLLHDCLLQTNAHKALVVLDCCFSGAIFADLARNHRASASSLAQASSANFIGASNIENLERVSDRSQTRSVLTSCRAIELSKEDDERTDGKGHGIFTSRLIEGWRGGGKGEAITGYQDVTVDSLYQYLWRSLNGTTQVPMKYAAPQAGVLVVNPHPQLPQSEQGAPSLSTPLQTGENVTPRSSRVRLAEIALSLQEVAVRFNHGQYEGWTAAGTEFITPPMIPVPAGNFDMGSGESEIESLIKAHQPSKSKGRSPDSGATKYTDVMPPGQRSVPVAAYEIGLFPVTVAEYSCFVRSARFAELLAHIDEKSRQPYLWQRQLDNPLLPVTGISWAGAYSFCTWLSTLTGQRFRLPTEAEWEKAARWNPVQQESRTYPWGNEWRKDREWLKDRCNVASGRIAPIGQHHDGGSWYGVQDLVANVWQWTASPFVPYPYSQNQAAMLNHTDSKQLIVVRGSSYSDGIPWFGSRAARREGVAPDTTAEDIGFRLVHDLT